MGIEKTLDERAKEYGEYKKFAKISQDLKGVIRVIPGYYKMEDYKMEAIDMIVHKLARILNGNSNNIDSWHDIAGYAKLVEDAISKERRAEVDL